ncbi:helix-turn-helix domain-containing protein [Streptomyces sp. NPDC049916]|uniref:helix-turn-helix domain-containing protein n=1 Tax=Streptomyces sp. NPDC049916 TaxID=3155156 RepID=UPI003445B4D0
MQENLADDFPLIDRAGGWSETAVLAEATSQIRFHDDRSVARFRAFSLGEVQLSVLRYSSMLVRRTPRLVRQSDPDMYGVCAVIKGDHAAEHAGRNVAFGGGHMLVYDSALPYYMDVDATRSDAQGMVVQIPKKSVPIRERHIRPVLGVTLGENSAVERMLFRFLAELRRESGSCTPQDLARLQTTVIDLVGAAVAHRVDREDQLPHEPRQRVLFLRAVAFIRGHLNHADLGPALVAAAHQVSVRTLHRIFEEQGTSVSCFIRRQRLERIRTDLTAPHLSHLTVHAIAARWGYPRPTAFSRAFRTAYGESPGAYRRIPAG